jgi:hypothetical protein
MDGWREGGREVEGGGREGEAIMLVLSLSLAYIAPTKGDKFFDPVICLCYLYRN